MFVFWGLEGFFRFPSLIGLEHLSNWSRTKTRGRMWEYAISRTHFGSYPTLDHRRFPPLDYHDVTKVLERWLAETRGHVFRSQPSSSSASAYHEVVISHHESGA